MSFLGPVGSLIPVKCASQLTSAGGREVSFARTLGKRKAFLGRVRAREWQVDIGLAKPAELSGLRWLAENVHSPMVWYSPDAVVGNILPPDQAELAPGTHTGVEGPLLEVESGLVVKSAQPDGSAGFHIAYRNGAMDPLPVLSGLPLTVSAWLRGTGCRIDLFWYDIDENFVSSTLGPTSDLPTLSRVSRTVTPPVGAHTVRPYLRCVQGAGPAVTVTESLKPYSPGRGSTRVVVHGLADAVLRATEDQQLESLSFVVSEVG